MRPVLCMLLFAANVLAPASALAASLYPDMLQSIVGPAPQELLAAFDALVQTQFARPRQLEQDGSTSSLFRILVIYSGLVGTFLIVSRLPRARRIT